MEAGLAAIGAVLVIVIATAVLAASTRCRHCGRPHDVPHDEDCQTRDDARREAVFREGREPMAHFQKLVDDNKRWL